MKLTRSRIVAAIVLVAVGAVFGWAATSLFRPPAPLPEGNTFSVVEVVEGDLSRSIDLGASASWSGGERLVNLAAGVLTQRALESGESVSSGDIVYSVDLNPVAVAVGDVPAFRDIAVGDRGADVSQLQQMLIDSGHRAEAPNELFDAVTLEQYRAWQRASERPVTDSVPLGSLIFVPSLPAVVGWEDASAPDADGPTPEAKGIVGTRLAEGDLVAQLLPPVPSFTIDLPVGQRRLVESGMPVTLSFGEHQWTAVIGEIAAPRDDGSAVAELTAGDGNERICGEDCQSIPVAGSSSITASITVVAPTSGLLVPTAVLAVAADGSTAVVDEDGQEIPVTTTVVVGGQAIVEGVDAGTRVRAPGQISSTGENDTAPDSPQPEDSSTTDPDTGEGDTDENGTDEGGTEG